MTTQFKTEKGSFLLVKVPDVYFGFMVDKLSDDDPNDYLYLTDGHHWIKLPPDQWQIVGNVWELTEQDWGSVVDVKKDEFWNGYKDYQNSNEIIVWADKSGSSLLSGLQIYKENPYGSRPEKKHYINAEKYVYPEILSLWEYSQERTGSFILLREI